MNDQMQAARARWNKLPTPIRWGGAIAIVLVFFVLVNDYAWATAGRLNSEADEIAATLARARAARTSLRADLERIVVARGPIRLPIDEARGTQAMADAVNEILSGRPGIAGYSYDSGAVQALGATVARGIVPPNVNVGRATGEVRFEATPDDAMAVIAEIESHPAIQAISRVQMARSAQRRVTVILTVETWVTTTGGGAGRFGR